MLGKPKMSVEVPAVLVKRMIMFGDTNDNENESNEPVYLSNIQNICSFFFSCSLQMKNHSKHYVLSCVQVMGQRSKVKVLMNLT